MGSAELVVAKYVVTITMATVESKIVIESTDEALAKTMKDRVCRMIYDNPESYSLTEMKVVETA